MNNNKQSSVEWLVKELNQKIDFIPMNKWDEITEVIEQAKAMHKDEMIDFTFQWSYERADRIDIEKDYNETFGGNNESN